MNPYQQQQQQAITLRKEFIQLDNHSPVRTEFIPDQGNALLHDHEFAEIAIVTHGRARHLTRYSNDWLAEGSVLVITPGQAHGFTETEHLGLINIYYLPEWFLGNLRALQDIDSLVPLFFQTPPPRHRDAREILNFRISPAEAEACTRELRDLEHENLRQPPQTLYLEACLIKVLMILMRAYTRGQKKHGTPAPQPDLHPAVVFALQSLEANVAQGEKPDMEAIARQCGISFAYFCRLFKEHTGTSATEYFQRRRIHRASHRLLTSKASIAEIAYSLGYADSAHFSRIFKALQGIAPSEYREALWANATQSPAQTNDAWRQFALPAIAAPDNLPVELL